MITQILKDSGRINERRFQRVRVHLGGRYMLESRDEHPCQTVDMSPGSIRLIAPARAEIGEQVIIYLDDLGRFSGVATRQDEIGFSISMQLSSSKRDKLANQLTWFANQRQLGLADNRSHERVVPLVQQAILHLPDGRQHIVKILEISISRVNVATHIRPPIGSAISIGLTPVVVTRHLENGLVGQFCRQLTIDELSEAILL
jgi:hypothetical protein